MSFLLYREVSAVAGALDVRLCVVQVESRRRKSAILAVERRIFLHFFQTKRIPHTKSSPFYDTVEHDIFLAMSRRRCDFSVRSSCHAEGHDKRDILYFRLRDDVLRRLSHTSLNL